MKYLLSLKALSYTASLLITGFAAFLILSNFIIYPNAQTSGEEQTVLEFNPPSPEDAPAEIKNEVILGYNILLDTPKYASEYVSGDVSCSNCHVNAGLDQKALPLVGVAAVFPRFNKRANATVDLITQTNNCIRGALKGKPLPPDSREMVAILTYYQWISKGIPIYADVPWFGNRSQK